MQLPLITLAALLWVNCCCVAEPARTVVIELERPFSLKPGEVASLPDAGLRVGFDGVTADSRCPKGEQCFRAGEAILRLWSEQPASARQVLELRTDPPGARRAAVGLRTLHLLRLDPYPVSGKSIRPGDYAALLSLGADGDAPEAER